MTGRLAAAALLLTLGLEEAAQEPALEPAEVPAGEPIEEPVPIGIPEVPDPAPPRLPAVAEVQLSGGAPVWVLSRRAVPLVRFEISLTWPGTEAGTHDELAAALASTVLQAGTKRRSGAELSAEMDHLGARWGLGVSTARLWAEVEVPTGDEAPALDLLVEALTECAWRRRPTRLAARRWASWREDIYLDLRRIHRRGLNHAWFPEGHSSRHTATPAELRHTDASDVRHLVERLLAEGRLQVAVVGDITPDAALALLEPRLAGLGGSLEPAPIAPVPATARLWLVDRPGFEAATFSVLTPAPARDDPAWPLARLLVELTAGGITSRMVADLREQQGLTYSVAGWLESWRGSGRIQFGAEVPAARTAEALLAMEGHLDRLAAGGVTAAELRAARNALIVTEGRRFATTASTTGWLGDVMVRRSTLAIEQQRLDALSTATPADVDALAAGLLAPEGRVWVITGDRAVIEPQLEAAGRVPDRIVSARILAEER
ncbi:MAG: insulinase family protein [Alphaproteobacteria bacterium]|nr:insulinase family protein [Alphaproteobacteria bacterium]